MEPRTTIRPPLDAFLDHEHQELDHLLADVEFLAERRSFVQAAKRFGEFRRSFEKHIHAEEKMLLPLFIERTGDPDRFTPALRGEHDRLLALVSEIGQSISQWDYAHFFNLLGELEPLLKEHHRNEERLLHPALDALLRDEMDWRCRCREACVDF